MADVILMPKPGDSRGKARLFTDVPVAYAREHLIPPVRPKIFFQKENLFQKLIIFVSRTAQDRGAMIVTFEYGPKKPGDER